MTQGPWDLLPHASPFLFLDRLTGSEPGRAARGTKLVSFAGGHRAVLFPPILVLEAVVQLGGIAWLGSDPRSQAWLAGINQAHFLGPVRIGDSLELRADVTRSFAGAARLRGLAAVGENEVVRAEFTLARRQPAGLSL